MSLKLRIHPMALIRLLLGFDVLVLDPYNQTVFKVQKGEDTYITKN